jgi:cytochrome P450
MVFVVAGHETTSNLMSFTLAALLRRPALWQDCLREVLSVCGENPPGYSHLSELPTCDAVLNETLRLFSPIPIVSREVYTETTIGGATDRPIHLPAKAVVQTHMSVIHRLKEYWGEDADKFDHTRWMKGKRPYTHPQAFMPFLTGPRGCIGSNFAMMEARLLLVLILQRCTMELVEGQKFDEEGFPIMLPAVGTMRCKYGLQVRVRPRSADERKSH